MEIINKLHAKLNWFSGICSVVYGLICASNPTPETVAVITTPVYFLSAAIFYFLMYCLWTSYTWQQKTVVFVKFAFVFIISTNAFNFSYMAIHKVSYTEADAVIGRFVNGAAYYCPFLP